jgi:uncharacterized protein with ParB-like and HNH nuclease domain
LSHDCITYLNDTQENDNQKNIFLLIYTYFEINLNKCTMTILGFARYLYVVIFSMCSIIVAR